ncbi:uncharacterized protein LOC141527153 [Cotesia typhae]|uniref:uncharacterized protein LOC141527153 n=1 Tax=Cotesia typhae TaxID=2053667 RepID=UPI003D686232
MTNDLKNTTRGTARDIGKQLVNKYPASFTVKNLSMDAAGASLGQKIYDRINYVKQDQIGNEASHSYILHDLEEPARKPKVQDEYGCVAYMPELPSIETWESQEQKRLELIEKYKPSKPVGDIKELMSQSYYLQRKNIIRENRDFTKIFTDWPYLTHYKIMIAHADRLLGQDCLKIWGNSLKDFYVPINCFSKNKEIQYVCAIEKFKKKNKGQSIPENLKYIHHELKKAKEYCDTLNNKVPYKNILFDFITKYMGTKEKLEYLYVIMKEDTSDEELLKLITVLNPVLIVRGIDIHNSSSQFNVVIEKNVIINVNSFLDGILITFLSYFIFRFLYPPEIEGTLEVIQRLFLNINPPRGTKRGGKRKAVIQHPKYTTFIEEINAFKNDDISDL